METRVTEDMTKQSPQERVKEIESYIVGAYRPEYLWLISRIHQLEGALEKVLNSEVVKQAPFNSYSEAISNAREALSEDPQAQEK